MAFFDDALYDPQGSFDQQESSSAVGAYTLTANAGSFPLTGVAAGFAVALPVAVGAFSFTGNGAILAVSQPEAAGTISLTGIAAGLRKQSKTAPVVGSFAETGNAATLRVMQPVTVAAFTLAGSAATFAVTQPEAAGTFVLTGNSSGLAVSHRIVASVGTFALTGNAANLNDSMPATVGTFSLSGSSAGMGVSVPASLGALALTGIAATLTHGGSHSIVASPGAFYETGVAVSFARTRKIIASVRAYELTGGTAHFGDKMLASGGNFTLAGVGATLPRHVVMRAQWRRFYFGGAPARVCHVKPFLKYEVDGDRITYVRLHSKLKRPVKVVLVGATAVLIVPLA